MIIQGHVPQSHPVSAEPSHSSVQCPEFLRSTKREGLLGSGLPSEFQQNPGAARSVVGSVVLLQTRHSLQSSSYGCDPPTAEGIIGATDVRSAVGRSSAVGGLTSMKPVLPAATPTARDGNSEAPVRNLRPVVAPSPSARKDDAC